MSKVVLVTGCSSGGIGFFFCEQFASAGCRVYATSRTLDSMHGFQHPAIQTLVLDVTDDDQVRSVVEYVLEKEGRIDILVNNAGAIGIGPIAEVSMDEARRVFEVNTFAILRTTRTVFPSMANRRSGLIVTVGSLAGEVSTPWNGLYCAAKAAAHALTEVLYMECKPFDVDVMLVSPGAVKSNIAANHARLFHAHQPHSSPSLSSSLYASFVDQMLARLHVSQNRGLAMPTETFAKRVVGRILTPRPPRYVAEGGGKRLFALLKILPRSWALRYMRWYFIKG